MNSIGKFLDFFNFGIKKDKNKKAIEPKRRIRDRKGKEKLIPERFPPQVRHLLSYWLNNCHDSASSFENRKDLYKDMDMLFYNSVLLARAMNMYADEVVQADSHAPILTIDANRKQKKFITEFFKNLDIDNLIRPAALDVVQYGSHLWALSYTESGINEVLPVDIYDFKDRIEFVPHEVKKQLKNSGSFLSLLSSKISRMKKLIQAIEEQDNLYGSFLKSYLFGFQVDDFAIPPWQGIHFRRHTSKSPFKPFGMPLFIHAVAPYRQFDAAMTLQVAARGAQFPIDLYKLNLPNEIYPTDKLDFALDFLTQLDNSGLRETKKEGIGIGERIITIQDLFEYEQISPKIDLKSIDDLEMLREDLIIASTIPRSFIDPNKAVLGRSGEEAVQQFKPVARNVYGIQGNILEGLTQMVKLQMIYSGEFSLEEIDFRLAMPFPEAATNRDIISGQADALRLANDILDALGEKLTGERGVSLPDELVKRVYMKLLPYEDSKIDEWLNLIIRERDKNPREEAKSSVQKEIKKLGQSVLNEVVDETIFQTKQEEDLNEGLTGSFHYCSSRKRSRDFDAKDFVDFKKSELSRFEEINLKNRSV